MLDRKKFNIWEGIFNNFRQAKKFQKGLGFNSKKWEKKQLEIFKVCKNYLRYKKKIPKVYFERNLDLIVILKKILNKKKKIKILDFGGGFGIAYYILRKYFENHIESISYSILEIPSVRKFSKKLNMNISFITKLEKQKKYTLIYSSSALQYVVNWKKTIIKFTKNNPDYIFLCDAFVGDIPTFVSLQNYYESKIPHWFINFNDLDDILKKNGYTLKSKKKTKLTRLNHKKNLPMQNFEKKYKLNNTLNLLYEKI